MRIDSPPPGLSSRLGISSPCRIGLPGRIFLPGWVGLPGRVSLEGGVDGSLEGGVDGSLEGGSVLNLTVAFQPVVESVCNKNYYYLKTNINVSHIIKFYNLLRKAKVETSKLGNSRELFDTNSFTDID